APPLADGTALGGADVTVTTLGTVLSGSRCNHPGLSVATTNSTAKATVTVCEKRSQVRRMKIFREGR
ncbi:MAG TPA: hypothetical protein VFG60_05485, partial [Burkholderiaceae bacterium]|nr:hypothetical protein [Burkholderiaceae bacterium]